MPGAGTTKDENDKEVSFALIVNIIVCLHEFL
jgi:hypothetical protein